MAVTVHIVASCTDRKHGAATVRLRQVDAGTIARRSRRWWQLLAAADPADTMPAERRYAGQHWSIARTLPDVATAAGHARVSLWVASAGYGLIPAAAPIHCYSATFAPHHPDSIAPGSPGAAGAAWWTQVARLPGPEPAAPRSLKALAAHNPDARLLVVGSPRYISALAPDLQAAAQRLDDPGHLVIVSSKRPAEAAPLAPHWVTSEARLRPLLGGSCMSLNARLARHILTQSRRWPLHAAHLRARYRRLLADLPRLQATPRRAVSDDHVLAFIAARLRADPTLTRARLLRDLRAGGMKCEQSRFARLHQRALAGVASPAPAARPTPS